MIVDLAIATGTAPRDWFDEDDETIATARQILDDVVEARRRR